MKPSNLTLLCVGAALVTAGALRAAPAAPTAAPAEKPQKLIRVSTLSTIEANREFQANVQVLQTQRQTAIELNTALEKETNAAKKTDLKGQLDALMAKLNENNDKMRKAYGFSLDRNYTLVIERAHVYLLATEEEAARVEKAEREQAKK